MCPPKPAMDLTLIRTQWLIMRMVQAQAGLSQPGPALWRIVGVRELAQLDLEEMLIQRPGEAAAGAEEIVRYALPKFCIVGHPGPKLSGVRAGAEQAAENLLSLSLLLPALAKPHRERAHPVHGCVAPRFGCRLPGSIALLTGRGCSRTLKRRAWHRRTPGKTVKAPCLRASSVPVLAPSRPGLRAHGHIADSVGPGRRLERHMRWPAVFASLGGAV